jgi:hypothetical protein
MQRSTSAVKCAGRLLYRVSQKILHTFQSSDSTNIFQCAPLKMAVNTGIICDKKIERNK